MPKLTIDGREVEVAPGTSRLQLTLRLVLNLKPR